MATVKELEKRVDAFQQDHDTLIRVEENVKTLVTMVANQSLENSKQIASLETGRAQNARAIDDIRFEQERFKGGLRIARFMSAAIGGLMGFIMALVTIVYYIGHFFK